MPAINLCRLYEFYLSEIPKLLFQQALILKEACSALYTIELITHQFEGFL